MQRRTRVSLADVAAAHPLEHGLAGLVAYLSLASDILLAVAATPVMSLIGVLPRSSALAGLAVAVGVAGRL